LSIGRVVVVEKYADFVTGFWYVIAQRSGQACQEAAEPIVAALVVAVELFKRCIANHWPLWPLVMGVGLCSCALKAAN
jgi:hypothetical protein